MTTQELRKIINAFPKYPGTKLVEPANLVNSGFPSCFNLSFAEGQIHDKCGQYLDYDQDIIFSTIQPCIRHQDWGTIVNNESGAFRYLSLFDMAGIGGITILRDKTKQEETAKFHMKAEFDFLKSIGLDLSKLRILYFIEAPISEATKGKYKIDKIFPTDPFNKYWTELGLRDDQLIPDRSRNTMLSLNIFNLPTPWGYRYEILYEYSGELWDVGTVEYLMYRPIFNEKNSIIDIVPFNHSIAVSVIGLERVEAILNNKKNVWEVDNIYPLVEFIMGRSLSKENYDAVVLAQSFRAIHKIISDGNVYQNLNKGRKEYVRNFYLVFFDKAKKLGIEYTNDLVKELGELNSKLNPWYPELNETIGIVVEEFNLRAEFFKNDKSQKHRDVAQ